MPGRMLSKIVTLTVVSLVAAMVVAACGGGSDPTAAPSAPETIVHTPTPLPTATVQVIVQTATPVPAGPAQPTPTAQVIVQTATPGPTPTPAPDGGGDDDRADRHADPHPQHRGDQRRRSKAGGPFRATASKPWRVPPQRGGTFVYGFAAPNRGTDLVRSQSFTVAIAATPPYNSIARCTPAIYLEVGDIGFCEAQGDLATAWTTSDGGKDLELHNRRGRQMADASRLRPRLHRRALRPLWPRPHHRRHRSLDEVLAEPAARPADGARQRALHRPDRGRGRRRRQHRVLYPQCHRPQLPHPARRLESPHLPAGSLRDGRRLHAAHRRHRALGHRSVRCAGRGLVRRQCGLLQGWGRRRAAPLPRWLQSAPWDVGQPGPVGDDHRPDRLPLPEPGHQHAVVGGELRTAVPRLHHRRVLPAVAELLARLQD